MKVIQDTKLDTMNDAYQAEFKRWEVSRRYGKPGQRDGFNLVRFTDHDCELVKLTRRECKDRFDAEAWLNTYRGRAAMIAAIAAGEGKTVR